MIQRADLKDIESLIDSLVFKTRRGELEWTAVDLDASLYETRLNHGTVRVRHAIDSTNDDLELDIFDLILLDDAGRLKERISTAAGWHGRGDATPFNDSARLSELYRTAKAAAERPEELVSNLLKDLM